MTAPRTKSKEIKPVAVKRERPLRVKRGYAGPTLADCIPHDDYRSADFNGPMVSP